MTHSRLRRLEATMSRGRSHLCIQGAALKLGFRNPSGFLKVRPCVGGLILQPIAPLRSRLLEWHDLKRFEKTTPFWISKSLTPSAEGVFIWTGMAISPLGGVPKYRVGLFEPRTQHARTSFSFPDRIARRTGSSESRFLVDSMPAYHELLLWRLTR